MPSRRARSIRLTPRLLPLFDQLERRQHSSQQLLRRLKIVRMAAEGYTNQEITRQLHLHRETARTWRQRWDEAAACLEAAVVDGATDSQLLRLIEAILADAPRPGGPPTFTPEQVVEIIALACEDPQATQQPFSHWTPSELARAAIQRGIVERISPRSVGRFLKGGRPQAPSEPLLAQRPPRGPAGLSAASGNGV